MTDFERISLELSDGEWEYEYTDHERQIARAIVVDREGYFYFVSLDRDDDFGKATVIETSGGGVEAGEELREAIVRELREELGAEVEILSALGVVRDYYNLIHRRNINNYYLCLATSFSEPNLTPEEREKWHITQKRLTLEEALSEYEKNRSTPLGRLIYQREFPVLLHAIEVINRRFDYLGLHFNNKFDIL